MLSAKSKIIVCGLCLCMFPFSTAALSQKSFDAMYAAAARGDVASLRSAMHRGLKIDSTDRAGNTGICVAVRNKDYVAYNSFIQAGARPNPPCLDRIAPSKYKKFVAAANKANPVTRNQYTPPAGRTAEEIQKAKDFSDPKKNPYSVDSRSQKQIEAYRKKEAARRKWLENYRQWERYRMTLGDKVPKTYQTFERHKMADDEKYKDWQRLYREANRET